MKRNDAIAFAMEYASYLIQNAPHIESILLFGSVARGDFDRESDIDIFVNIKNSGKKDEDAIRKITNNYYNTKSFEKWRLFGIKHDISVITGDIDSNEWAELKRSMMTDGILLYGKYMSKPPKLSHFMLLTFESVKDDKKRVAIHRKLFGYKLKGKKYSGLVEKENGVRISSNAFMIKIESYRKIKSAFSELKISPRIIEVWKE